MRSSLRLARRSCLTLGLLALAAGLAAQTATEVGPQAGQPGKDVLWLPTPQVLVDRMLDMANVTSTDVVMDLGSGDGRLIIAAAKRGAQAVGVEYNPELVALATRNAAVQRVNDRATFIRGDLFEADLSKATVITLFLRLDLNLKLRPTLLALEPGTRVVSNTFSMDDWEPDDIFIGGRDCANCTAMLWIIPARVEGDWRLPQGEMTLTQTFQDVMGTLRTGRASLPVSDGRLRGNQITFTAGGVQYKGRVSDATIEGTATTSGTSVRWTAMRSR
jgi:SAM-dependent methyltransferase